MGRLLEGVAWAAVCLAVWLLTLSSVTSQDLLVASLSAVVCGVAAVGGRIAVGGRWTVRRGWLRWPLKLVVSAPVETVQTIWAAARRRPGKRTTVRLPEREPKYVSASRRGIGTVLLSASPGSYVIDDQPHEREMYVHRLGRGAPDAVRIDMERG